MKIALFQSCGHCWVFQICWHIECSTYTASSLRIWNSSAGIPSPSLALFIVMLPKAHLTLCSGISDSRWVITPLWLSGSLRSFLYNYFMYCFHLFLISYASIWSIHFLSFIVPIFAWNVPLVSLIFLKSFLVFPILFFSSISLHWSLSSCYSLELYIQMGISFLFYLLLLFFSQLFVRPPKTTILPFCISFLGGMVLITASCTMSWTSVHISSGTLSNLIPWIYLSLPTE